MNDVTYFKTSEECQEFISFISECCYISAVGELTAIYVDECTNKMYRSVIDKLMYISIRGGDSALDIHFIDGDGAFDE